MRQLYRVYLEDEKCEIYKNHDHFLRSNPLPDACCKAKKCITRELPEIASRNKMSEMTKKVFALIGSLASFRVSEKIVGMFGINLNKMAIWRCVQKVGKSIEFDIDINESNEFEAEGTGIPIQWIKKRGKELKVFIQKRILGGVRIAGLTLGNYHSEWDKLFGN